VLTGLVAHPRKLIQPRWIAGRQPHRLVPAVGEIDQGCARAGIEKISDRLSNSGGK